VSLGVADIYRLTPLDITAERIMPVASELQVGVWSLRSEP